MGYDFSTTRIRRARRAHRCSWCLGEISRGETYEHGVALYCGHFSRWRLHSDCVLAAATARELCGCGPSQEDFCAVCNPDSKIPRATIPDPDDDATTISIVQACMRIDEDRAPTNLVQSKPGGDRPPLDTPPSWR